MTVTISPSLGAGALFTQQGVGTTPGYSALDDRRAASLALQEGVYGASDFMVVQRAAGANLSVDIGMPAGGFACVQGDAVAGQGLYTVPVHSGTINELVNAADATNPRIDQVILEVLDNVHDASGNNLARTRILAGTPTSGATLANRSGVAALPGGALLLADVLVGANVSTIPNTVIRDRRKWARGAYVRIIRNSADYTTASATTALVDSTNLNPRIEASGAPMRARVRGSHAGAPTGMRYRVWMDSAEIDTGNQVDVAMASGSNYLIDIDWEFVPAAGSHLFGPAWAVQAGAGTATLKASSGNPLIFTVEELVRQNAANNATTSG